MAADRALSFVAVSFRARGFMNNGRAALNGNGSWPFYACLGEISVYHRLLPVIYERHG